MCKILCILLLGVRTAMAGLSQLEALSQIESGDNDAAIGLVGEVSRYQIRPHLWREYTTSRAYQNAPLAAQVARRHLASLEALFHRHTGRAPTDFDLYVLWNAGPTYYAKIRFARSRVSPVVRERAQRFVNLCQPPPPPPLRALPQLAHLAPPAAPPWLQPLPPLLQSPMPVPARPGFVRRDGFLAIGGVPLR